MMISTQQESRTRQTFIEINRSRLSWTRYIRTKLMVRHAWKGKGNCLGSLPHDFRRRGRIQVKIMSEIMDDMESNVRSMQNRHDHKLTGEFEI